MHVEIGKEVAEEPRNILLRYLNELCELDLGGIGELIELRVPVNDKIAKHPSVIVDEDDQLGVLGVLNGFLGMDKRICAACDESGNLIEFRGYQPPEPKE